MANLNLSQFTEKTFVADADWVFVWDTAGAISKKVSRNSLLSVGSIATSAPVTISQTWTDAAVPFAAMKIVATDTNSLATSDFLELYSGTSTQPLRLDIQKTGQVNIYGTWTNSTTYERLSLSAPTAANAIIGTNKGSGGGTARGLEFQTDGVTRMTIQTTGTVDFGAGISTSSSISVNSGSYIMWGGGASSRMSAPSNGIIQFTNAATTGFDRLQFGSTTDTFPAIARDGAGIKFTGAAAGLTSHIKVPAVAVASLPDAATAGVGARAFVNNASTPIFGSAVSGGGAVAVPVYSTGSAWNVG